MDKGNSELEFDEFEKLLGEIPNVTSGNPNSEESRIAYLSKDLKRVSLDGGLSRERPGCIHVNTVKRALSGSLDEAKVSVNRIQAEEPTLGRVQSMTSAFTEMSFKDRAAMGASCCLVNYMPLNNSVSVNGQFPDCLKKLPSSVDSRVMVVPSPQLPINSSNGLNMFDLDFQDFKRQQMPHVQPIENLSTTMPLVNGMQGFHLLSNVPVAGVEFPFISNQRQYYLDSQPPIPYIHPQQLSQPHMMWGHTEEEQYYGKHQQYLYLQQQSEAQHPFQSGGRILSPNRRQPCNDVLISGHVNQFHQEPFWLKDTGSRRINHSSSIPSSAGFVHVLDKLTMQTFPERILTRSPGVNSLRSVKFGSFAGHESAANANQNGRPPPNGCFQRNSYNPSVAFQLDNLALRGLSPDISDLKYNYLGQPLQTCNSIDEITGRILLMAKDQNGCRFLQRKFTEGTQEDVKKIFTEIIVQIVELMTDPFGNYLVQKLLEVCNEDQRMQIIHAITTKTGELVRISCDLHGTRAVQKVIETLKSPEQFSMIVSSLKPGIVNMIKNMNGNHVAQRCLQYLTPEYCQFLFEAAAANCVELATDRHGCCVLQKCLGHSDGEQRRRLIREITSNAVLLSQDPFGNYVVQFVFEIHVLWAISDILDQLEGNYGDLSMQKYSSNVVEKCLKHAGDDRRSRIIQELTNNHRLDQIMQDPYGNYVIQAALNHSKGTLRAALLEAIKPHIPALRTSPYGKKVLSSNNLKK